MTSGRTAWAAPDPFILLWEKIACCQVEHKQVFSIIAWATKMSGDLLNERHTNFKDKLVKKTS